ncbi:MAG: FG-GAP-like repeat-containing protein [Gammaproteobacteria bacterium]|nr:FG-GAP-like repeat-containing protein [Gammaproteobacteria bacterium]
MNASDRCDSRRASGMQAGAPGRARFHRPSAGALWTLGAAALAALPVLGAHLADFDGDGKDDVLLWDQDAWHVFEMDGSAVAAGETEAPDLPRGEDWQVAGVGDLNGDGNDDVLFRHDDGAWAYHAMDGRHGIAAESGSAALPRSLAWGFAGIGDLNGDGTDDVLLRHAGGRWLYFQTDGRFRNAAGRRIALPSALEWRFAGIGDLNGDGTDDVLLRHADGRWFYHAVRDGRVLPAESGPADLPGDFDGRLAGIGDLNADGTDDVLLRNAGGSWFYYAMDGPDASLEESGRADITNGPSWRIVGVGDLNGDGADDVLLQNANGSWHYYAMDGRASVAAHSGEADLPPTGAVTVCGESGGSPSYVGYIAGFAGNPDDVEVVLTSQGSLQVARPDYAGCFAFRGVADGEYAIKINARGHSTTAARVVKFPFRHVYDDEPHLLRGLPTDPFVYHWEEDQTTAGAEYSSYIVEPRVVEFHGAAVDVADTAAADSLRQKFNILLTGDGWSQEHAFRLLETMESIPQDQQSPANGRLLPASTWRLTDDFIDNDVAIEAADDGTREVRISSAVFVNATPRIATVDGKRGVWFSRRLHHAAVRFVTDHGRDEGAYERIFEERFGVTTRIDDYAALTRWTTGPESEANFQRFHASEILLLINMLEEMPAGMHKLDGMRYLVRRLNGLPHPVYPTAPAVAWPQSEYVEFMERAFRRQSEDYMHRLIIHEKAHFLWAHLFDDQLKADWIELGGWYEDPDAESGWSTSKTTEFVSAYAHAKNPNEDMAETISFFIINPDRLRARSAGKYEFVRDRIMQGDIYVAAIREDLTFEVYNLYPDYVYPGKIRQVDITVAGGPRDDKLLTVDVELHALDAEAEGAERGYARLKSDIGTFFDLWLYPVDEYGDELPSGELGTRLRGEFLLSKYAKAGYWLPEQIQLRDAAGNERYQRTSDFGWRMYVNNYLEDYTRPAYVAGTLSVAKSVWDEDDTVQVVRVDWFVDEDTAMRSSNACYAAMHAAIRDTYSYREHGDASDGDDMCTVEFLMPNYMPSSEYSVNYISMVDIARNFGTAKFTGEDGDEDPATIELTTTNPDTEPPELDVNRIEIDAEPVNPEAPNGETEVTVSLRHRDNISGLSVSKLLLRDPQGGTHLHYIYPADAWELYPTSDPTEWQTLERVVILPPGSIPGTWGLAEVNLVDRAGNSEPYNFVEIVHFDVEGG